jgi:hypothetical protein
VPWKAHAPCVGEPTGLPSVLKSKSSTAASAGPRGGDRPGSVDGVGFRDAVEGLCGKETNPHAQRARPSRRPPKGHSTTTTGNAPATYGRRPSTHAGRSSDYLRSRALDRPDEIAGGVIKFHSHCPMGLERHPAMVCLVRGIVSNEPRAIIRTALSPNGVAVKRGGRTHVTWARQRRRR